MGATYPDVYAAVGIHSGLAYGSANDVLSAFAVMRGEAGIASRAAAFGGGRSAPPVRTIVLQGGADTTVHPANAQRIVAAASADIADAQVHAESGRSTSGRAFSRTVIAGPDGAPKIEYWLVEGAGHAWSGGDASGSYTDPDGPDASAAMIRFFLAAQGAAALT
jgi:poly(3-hydroxybutyrate) depolymerase